MISNRSRKSLAPHDTTVPSYGLWVRHGITGSFQRDAVGLSLRQLMLRHFRNRRTMFRNSNNVRGSLLESWLRQTDNSLLRCQLAEFIFMAFFCEGKCVILSRAETVVLVFVMVHSNPPLACLHKCTYFSLKLLIAGSFKPKAFSSSVIGHSSGHFRNTKMVRRCWIKN